MVRPFISSGDRLGNFARQDRGFERQLLFGANRDVVARDDAARLEDFVQAGRDLVLGGIHALVERLHHEVVAVAIDHQGGQQVGLAVDHAIGVGAVAHDACGGDLRRRGRRRR